jgi:uncharacterized repeat protein (TIGR01451 family)
VNPAASCTITVPVTTAAAYVIGACPNAANTNGAVSISALANLANGVTDQCVAVTAATPVLSKAFTPIAVSSGSVSTITVTISNANAVAITVTSVTDTFPVTPGAGLVRAATPNAATTCAGGTVTSTAGSLTLTGGTVPASGSCTFQIDVMAASNGSYVNTIPAGALTTNAGSNAAAASATLTVSPVANLAIVKAGPATVATNGAISYTLTISNAGPDAANAATFADNVPAQITGVTAGCGTPLGGAVCGAVNVAGNNVTGTVTTLPSGGSVVITINGTATGVGTLTNTATVATPAGVADPTPANNTSTSNTTILAPDLTISKSHAGNFTVGVNGVYTLTVANLAGTLPTSGVITVVDTLPSGLTFVSAVGAGWACGNVAQTVTCTSAAAIPAGGSATPITLTVSVGPTAVPSVLNLANVSGGNEPAANANNNVGSDNTIVVSTGANTFQPNNTATGAAGTAVLYTHTYNAAIAGSVAFTTSNVATPAIAGWTQQLYRDTNCNGVLDGAEGAAVLAAPVVVVAGDQVCIIIRDNIPAAAPVNAQDVITVSATFNGTQVLTRTDTTTVSGTAGSTLTLAKTVRNVTQGGAATTSGSARPNDILEYTITYSNPSAGAVTNVVVNDATPTFTQFQSAVCNAPLPANLTGCSVTTQPAANGGGPIVWTLTGTLQPGGSGSVTYTVRVQP